MAAFRHPETGILLNRLDVVRQRLNEAEQETARLLRRNGYKVQDIAAMLGTNQGRVQQALGPTGRMA